MYKEDAFENIRYIFSSLEHEEKSNSWKQEELLKVLTELQRDSYNRGLKEGYNHAMDILREYKPTN